MKNKAASVTPIHQIEREINDCTVRLFFPSERNDKVERLILDSLITVFEQKTRDKAFV